MTEATPVVETPSPEVKAVPAPEVKKVSPAQDLREIQALLVSGVFSGQMAPALCKAYNLLENMARQVEKDESQNKA